jgi:FkbM family methyltransferase
MTEPGAAGAAEAYGNAEALRAALEAHLRAYPYRTRAEGGRLSLLLPHREALPWHLPLSRRRLRLRPRPLAYEPVATALVDFLIARMPGGTFLDIGAEIGYFAHLAASRADLDLSVHAFEMRPDHLARLEERTAALGLDRVRAHLAGMSDRERGTRPIWYSVTRMFETEPPSSAYRDPVWRQLKFRLKGRPGRDRLRRAEVRVDSIDSFCAREGVRPGLVKIDVDGYEGRVVAGGAETFRAARPAVLLELHRRRFLAPHGDSRGGVVRALLDLGYRGWRASDPGDLARCRMLPLSPGGRELARDRTDLLLFL